MRADYGLLGKRSPEAQKSLVVKVISGLSCSLPTHFKIWRVQDGFARAAASIFASQSRCG
jgi:hypothetical protein